MIYYIKKGQSSIFSQVKFWGNECHISNMTLESKSKKIEKIVKKIDKKKVSYIVLSKELKENEEFIKTLKNYDITILDGKWLMQCLLQEILVYIEKKKKLHNKIEEIAVLVNDLSSEVRQQIKELAIKYKKIRIVSNHPEKFKKLENELFETAGISTIITNNKRKALSKSQLIINFDFVEELINQYNINENAIIVNLGEKIKINKKRFSGLVITDYEVSIEEKYDEDENDLINIKEILEKEREFSLKEILEEKLYSNLGKQHYFTIFQAMRNTIKKYNIKIKELYGANGILS